MTDLWLFLEEAPLWPLAALAAVSILVGWLLGQGGRKKGASSRRSVTTQAGTYVELEVYRESQKEKARLEQENQALNEFFSMMDDFAKKMGGRLSRSELLDNLMTLIERMFAPQQILIFLARGGTVPFLFLARSKGLPHQCPSDMRVSVGEGKIGLVAQDGVARGKQEFIRAMREGAFTTDVPAQSPLKIELCAPMAEDRQIVGVISIGGITRHHKRDMGLLKTIASWGAVALTNQLYVSERQRSANSDGLTGLSNKRFLQHELGLAIHAAERSHHPLSILLFDLDHFKKLNDTYGHLVGDEVLKGVAQILRSAALKWPEDVLPARWGGEEFLVIFPRLPKKEAWKRAEALREELARTLFKDEQDQALCQVTLSGGVASFPDDGRQQSELVRAADAALYQAKKSGRNRIMQAQTQYLSEDEDGVQAGEAELIA